LRALPIQESRRADSEKFKPGDELQRRIDEFENEFVGFPGRRGGEKDLQALSANPLDSRSFDHDIGAEQG
jgi:hypothetical protein